MSSVARLSITAVVLLALFCVFASGASVTCKGGYALKRFDGLVDRQSVYRIWGHGCAKVPFRSSQDCEWIDANFNSGATYSFACDDTGTKALTGSKVSRDHCENFNDSDCKSNYSFQCCGFSDSPKFECKTVQVTELRGEIEYEVPDGKVVTEISSDVKPSRYVNFKECSLY